MDRTTSYRRANLDPPHAAARCNLPRKVLGGAPSTTTSASTLFFTTLAHTACLHASVRSPLFDLSSRGPPGGCADSGGRVVCEQAAVPEQEEALAPVRHVHDIARTSSVVPLAARTWNYTASSTRTSGVAT